MQESEWRKYHLLIELPTQEKKKEKKKESHWKSWFEPLSWSRKKDIAHCSKERKPINANNKLLYSSFHTCITKCLFWDCFLFERPWGLGNYSTTVFMVKLNCLPAAFAITPTSSTKPLTTCTQHVLTHGH
jgi:hypothetical protein